MDLAVFLAGQRVGTISQGSGVEFVYDEAYLATRGATPLSLSMPLTSRRHANRVTRSWVEGLLPGDRAVRARIAHRGGANPNNPVALLAVVGLDCPGSVQVCPVGEEETVERRNASLEPVDDWWIEERLAMFARDASSWQIADERWSLGGAQSKFTLTRIAGGWADPQGSAASTHLVKPGVPGARDQALNEHLCLRILGRAGLRVAASQYLEFGARGAIVERRFDRVGKGDEVRRLHAEDLCQALGRRHAYERDGGPHAKDVCSVLSTRAGTASRDRFVDALLATYLIGAPDGHARNYSVVLQGEAVELAPLYDVASSLPYDVQGGGIMHQRTVAMSLGGERRFGMVRQGHLRRLFEVNSLDVDAWLERSRQLAQMMPDAVSDERAASAGIRGADELLGRMLPGVVQLCTGVLKP